MRAPRPVRLPAAAVTGAVAVAVFAFTLGSTSVRSLLDAGLALRWVALAALAAVAIAAALSRGASVRLLGPLLPLVAFVALALVSGGWSVDPRLTAARAASFALLLVAVVAIALAARADPSVFDAALLGILLGAAAVAIGGLLALADPEVALQPGLEREWRFRGLGSNPNTVPMLMAVATPVGVWAATRFDGRRRLAARTAVVLFLGTSVAAGSRGAVVGAAAGLLVLAVLLTAGRRRLVLAGLAIALVPAGFAIRALPDALAEEQPPLVVGTDLAGQRPVLEDHRWDVGMRIHPELGERYGVTRLEDEQGFPAVGEAVEPPRNPLLGSGRVQAWQRAVEQAAGRPLLGYGFGTEERVFLDSSFLFQGSRPENSYLGLLLQLGVAGLALFLAAVALPLARAVAEGLPAGADRRRAAAALAVVATGVVLAIFQSYVYSVGNVATLSFWLALALVALAVPAARPAAPAARAPRPSSEVAGVR